MHHQDSDDGEPTPISAPEDDTEHSADEAHSTPMADLDGADSGDDLDSGDEIEDGSSGGGKLARARDVMPGRIPLLPVASRPFFPGQAVPLLMDASHWGRTIEAVANSDHKILGIVLVNSETSETAKVENFREIGTAARVHRAAESEGKLQVHSAPA